MKLEVGMYVRYKNGNICKIIDFKDDPTDYYFNCYETNIKNTYSNKFITEYDIDIKSSPNIIDLIEAGDYVNGHKVFKKEEYQIRVEDRENTWGIAILDETDIKSIVTKESMESVTYYVK